MANPSAISVPPGAWLKIATAVQLGIIKILNFDAAYHFTYRMTGDAAPVAADREDSQRCNQPSALIEDTEDIDVYVFCTDDTGRIEVAV
jgi:hypothetical protein